MKRFPFLFFFFCLMLSMPACASGSLENPIVFTYDIASNNEVAGIVNNLKDQEIFRNWDKYQTYFCKYSGYKLNEKDQLQVFLKPLDDEFYCPVDAVSHGNLVEISLPEGIRIIKRDAASSASGTLKRVTLPCSIEIIEDFAFANCGRLKTINFPASLYKIGMGAFSGCYSLTNIDITYIQQLGDRAFEGCESLQMITIPSTIIDIPKGAFQECRGLQMITIPDGIETIGDDAFNSCSSLSEVIVPDSVSSIGSGAFAGCSSLRYIKLSERLESLSYCLFSYCSQLEELKIPKSVKKCEPQVLDECNGLRRLMIPLSLSDVVGRLDVWDYPQYIYKNNRSAEIIFY